MKEKIIGTRNTQKTLWIRIKTSPTLIENINSVLENFGNREGLTCFGQKGKDLPSYKSLINEDLDFLEDALNLVFCPNQLKIILDKESKLFPKLKKAIFQRAKYAKNS